MKGRIVPIAACFTVLLLSAALAACGHQHTYGAGWTYDATHHWHEATCEHSEETEGKAEHTWDGGEVTTPATCTEAGLKTYTCTVCSATKTEVIAATGHSWNSGDVTVPVSCLVDGITIYTCTVCNATKQETTLATGHVWNDGEVTTPAGCLTDGTTTYTCTVCSAIKTEPIAATGHSYSEEWTADATHHWHAATCEHADEKKDYAEHTYENNICTVCGKPYESIGLAFTISADNASYTVSGIGTCTDTEIYIPATYNGLPVKEIGQIAFYENTTITGVVFPDSITTIDYRAFYGCIGLTSVTIPDSMTGIGNYAFEGCSSLKSVTIGNNVTSVGHYAFYGCNNLATFSIFYNLYFSNASAAAP